MNSEDKTKEQLFEEPASLRERMERCAAELANANDRLSEISHGISAKAAEPGLRKARDDLEGSVKRRMEDLTATSRALAESEERYRILFESALDIIYSVSAGWQNQRLEPGF